MCVHNSHTQYEYEDLRLYCFFSKQKSAVEKSGHDRIQFLDQNLDEQCHFLKKKSAAAKSGQKLVNI
jgi:uncharacterized protein YutD